VWTLDLTGDTSRMGEPEEPATSSGLPALVRPMLATPGELPPAEQDELWAYEVKWDGVLL
jgi:bifunctional non-homologous end joining protein LigD